MEQETPVTGEVPGEPPWGRMLCRLARLLFYVAVPLLLVTTNVRFAFSEERVYQYSIDHYDVTAVTHISHSDLIAATQDIRTYFTNDADYLRTRVHDSTGAVVPLFNPKEVLHMRDVKHLVRLVYGIETLLLAFVSAYVVAVYLWAGEERLTVLARRTLQACAGTVLAMVAFGAVAATGFDSLFLRFHELSFGNDFWQLDPARDHLVQMFPEGFWLDATLLIAGLTVAEVCLLGGAALLYLHRHPGSVSNAVDQPAAPTSDQTDQKSDRPGDIPQPVG